MLGEVEGRVMAGTLQIYNGARFPFMLLKKASPRYGVVWNFTGCMNALLVKLFYSITMSELTMDLHTLQKLDNDLTARSDQNLTLSSLFGVGDCLQTIG